MANQPPKNLAAKCAPPKSTSGLFPAGCAVSYFPPGAPNVRRGQIELWALLAYRFGGTQCPSMRHGGGTFTAPPYLIQTAKPTDKPRNRVFFYGNRSSRTAQRTPPCHERHPARQQAPLQGGKSGCGNSVAVKPFWILPGEAHQKSAACCGKEGVGQWVMICLPFLPFFLISQKKNCKSH